MKHYKKTIYPPPVFPYGEAAVYLFGQPGTRGLAVDRGRAVRLACHLIGRDRFPADQIYSDWEWERVTIRRGKAIHQRRDKRVSLVGRKGLFEMFRRFLDSEHGSVELFRPGVFPHICVIGDIETAFPGEDLQSILHLFHTCHVRVYDAVFADEHVWNGELPDKKSATGKRLSRLKAKLTLDLVGIPKSKLDFAETTEGKAALALMKKLGRKPKNGNRSSYEKIASQLNQQGCVTESGRPWTAANVRSHFKKYFSQLMGDRKSQRPHEYFRYDGPWQDDD